MLLVVLKQIEPSNYCRVFGDALDGYMLSKILEVLKNFYIRSVNVRFTLSICSLFVVFFASTYCYLLSYFIEKGIGSIIWLCVLYADVSSFTI